MLSLALLTITNHDSFSGGSVTLKSNDPFEQPNVDLGFYNTDLDIGIALQAFKTTEAQMTNPIMSGFTMDRVAPPLTATTDNDIITFIRNTTRSASHGIGTAAMSAKGSKEGVVDPNLKVKGINGVRVVDASVMVRPLGIFYFDFDVSNSYNHHSRLVRKQILRPPFILWRNEPQTLLRRTGRFE